MSSTDELDDLPHVKLDVVNNRIRRLSGTEGASEEGAYAKRGVLTLQKYKLLMEMKKDPRYIVDEVNDLSSRKYRIRFEGVDLFETKIPKAMVEGYEKNLGRS